MVVQSAIYKSQVHRLVGRPPRGVASGLRLGQVPSLPFAVATVWFKGQQTIHKALVQSDDSIYCSICIILVPALFLPHGAVARTINVRPMKFFELL